MANSSEFEWPLDSSQDLAYLRYEGQFTPQKLAFNANLQEFAHHVHSIAAARALNCITAEEAFHHIDQLWDKLNHSKRNLGL